MSEQKTVLAAATTPAAGGVVGEGWRGCDWAGKVLRWSITFAPLVVAAAVSVGLSVVAPAASSWLWAVVRVLVIAALSMSMITVVERAGRRLLPLATLLRLSLVFPDETPSRLKMALKAGSGKRMERALIEARRNGLSADRAQAAEQLVLLSIAIGAHDPRTRGHSERVRLYAQLLGEELHLNTDELSKLQWAALIHDMGKITVPPEILNKKGKPSDAEWAVLQNHPMRGEALVAPVAGWLGEWVHAVGGHHERWDGTGYPRKLAGHDISRAAAIVAVADSFEVMTAVRSYKSAMSLADARAELARCSGSHFHPDMVRAFLNISLPKLRRAGGVLGSLAHVPFIGNSLTASTKAAEGLSHGTAYLASTGGGAIAAAAVSGMLIASPAHSATQRSLENAAITANDTGTQPGVTQTPTPRGATTNQPLPDPATATPTTRPATPAPAITEPDSDGPHGSPPPSGNPTLPTDDTNPPTTTTPPPGSPPITDPTTAPPPTTTPPVQPPTQPSQQQIYYLTNPGSGNTTSDPTLLMTTNVPTATALPNYDTDRDTSPGLLLRRSGSGIDETDPAKYQRWSTNLNPESPAGETSLRVWIAVKDFTSDKQGRLTAALQACPASLSTCQTIRTASVLVDQSQAPGGFLDTTFNFGNCQTDLAPGHVLSIKLVVDNNSDDDLWIAYDTTNYPSALTTAQ